MGRLGDRQERGEGRLVAQITEDADHVKTEILGQTPEARAIGRRSIRAQAHAEAWRVHVTASVGILLKRVQ